MYVYAEGFTTSRTGTIDATVDYTYTTNQILVWIARGTCTYDQFSASQCDYAATSFAGPKPRKVSVTAAAAGTYTLLVANLGPDDDAVAYQVMLTPTAGTSGGVAIRALPGKYLVQLPQP
jgi:hypothetical protein